jgi:hypothetical protein
MTGDRYKAFQRASQRRYGHDTAAYFNHLRAKDRAAKARYGDHATLVRRTSAELQQVKRQISEHWWRLDTLERYL